MFIIYYIIRTATTATTATTKVVVEDNINVVDDGPEVAGVGVELVVEVGAEAVVGGAVVVTEVEEDIDVGVVEAIADAVGAVVGTEVVTEVVTIVQLTTIFPGWNIVLSGHGVPSNTSSASNAATLLGITIDSIVVPRNALSPIDSNWLLASNKTCSSVEPQNAPHCISVTLLGITIDVISTSLPANAFWPIISNWLLASNNTSTSPDRENAKDCISVMFAGITTLSKPGHH